MGDDASGEHQWHGLTGQLHLMVLNYLIELKDYAAATKHARDLAQRYPNDINFHSGLGRLYLQLGDLDRAHHVFQGVDALVKRLPSDAKEQSHFKLQLTMNRQVFSTNQFIFVILIFCIRDCNKSLLWRLTIKSLFYGSKQGFACSCHGRMDFG